MAVRAAEARGVAPSGAAPRAAEARAHALRWIRLQRAVRRQQAGVHRCAGRRAVHRRSALGRLRAILRIVPEPVAAGRARLRDLAGQLSRPHSRHPDARSRAAARLLGRIARGRVDPRVREVEGRRARRRKRRRAATPKVSRAGLDLMLASLERCIRKLSPAGVGVGELGRLRGRQQLFRRPAGARSRRP